MRDIRYWLCGIMALAILFALLPGSVLAEGLHDEPEDAFVGTHVRPSRLHKPGGPGADDPVPSPIPTPGAAAPTTSGATHYTIKPGDTLFAISTQYGLSVDAIARANGLGENSILSLGMDLVLPYTNEVGTATMGPHGPTVKNMGLHFVVSDSRQKCWLFKDREIIATWPCSTGRKESKSALGNYTVQSKLDRGYSDAADAWMPYWLGIYTVGNTENGVHGIPYRAKTGEKSWLNDIGIPVTYGCVMLGENEAKMLYSMAYIGMPVTLLP